MAMKLRKSQVFVHTSAAVPHLIYCICLHKEVCDMQLYFTLARWLLTFNGSPLSLLIFRDFIGHNCNRRRETPSRLHITCDRSLTRSVCILHCVGNLHRIFGRLASYHSTLPLSLSSNVLRSMETYTATPPLQSYSPWPRLTCIIIRLIVRHDREHLDSRLALYLAETAAVED